MNRILPLLAILPWLVLGAAVLTRAGSPDPLPAPPAQDALPAVETFGTGIRKGVLVRVDLAPVGADVPNMMLWSDPSHGTVIFDRRPGQ